MLTTDIKTHRGHVVGPFTMSSLKSLHSVKVIDDPDHITHPEAVVLDDREANKGSSSSYLYLLRVMWKGHILLHKARRQPWLQFLPQVQRNGLFKGLS